MFDQESIYVCRIGDISFIFGVEPLQKNVSFWCEMIFDVLLTRATHNNSQ